MLQWNVNILFFFKTNLVLNYVHQLFRKNGRVVLVCLEEVSHTFVVFHNCFFKFQTSPYWFEN